MVCFILATSQSQLEIYRFLIFSIASFVIHLCLGIISWNRWREEVVAMLMLLASPSWFRVVAAKFIRVTLLQIKESGELDKLSQIANAELKWT